MALSFEEARYVNSFVQTGDEDTQIAAARVLVDFYREKFPDKYKAVHIRRINEAREVLRAALHVELDSEQYLIGATLCWGTTLFDSRPKSVRLIWDGMKNRPQLLIFGAGSMGKSYTAIVHGLLDWERDPEFTTTKLASTTAGHERAQTFSNLVRLHRFSAVPLSGYIKQGFIGLDKDDKRSSISEVAIDQGDENKSAKLQGFHPLPRPYAHPKFGTLTRVRGIFDELEDIPVGIWKGEANMMLNLDDEMHVAIVGMWNPKRRDSVAAQKAEPIGGWANLDERVDEYTSRAGYHVIRLDARKCENVVEREVIYYGLQTYEAFKALEDKGGAEFDTFGKGLYPKETAAFNIISPMALDHCRGLFRWGPRLPTNLATLDMAEEGEDRAEYTAAKYGLAIGFQPEGKKLKMFDTPRWCVQIEQQFSIAKQNTILMGREAIRMCRSLFVRPEWFGLDCTNSVTLRDWITLKWGPILGIQWGEGATEMPILEEESQPASELYSNVKTELFFATGAWAEFGFLAFSPSMDTSELFSELTGMRYKPVSKTMKQCEPTKEFKKRYGGKSPDKAASCVMIIHVVRSHATVDQRAAIEPENKIPERDLMGKSEGSFDTSEESEVIDAIDFI